MEKYFNGDSITRASCSPQIACSKSGKASLKRTSNHKVFLKPSPSLHRSAFSYLSIHNSHTPRIHVFVTWKGVAHFLTETMAE